MSTECVRAVMKMTYCPYCSGVAFAKPCSNYCKNVMKGCLANQADLDSEWRNLAGRRGQDGALIEQQSGSFFHDIKTLCLCVDSMLEVADKLSRPYSVDSVVLSLPKRIAEAILYMEDNLNTFNNKVSATI